MKYFLRASKYIFRYRLRFAAAIACSVMQAVLWVGGFTALLPIMKIFFSEEGLHGWLDRSIVENRLDLKLTVRKIHSEELRSKWDGIDEVATVIQIPDSSIAKDAGLQWGYWVIGANDKVMDYPTLMQTLAQTAPDESWKLLIYRPEDATQMPLTVEPEQMGAKARAASYVSAHMKRPTEWSHRFDLLVQIIIAVLVVNFLQNFFKLLQTYLARSTVCRGLLDLRNDVYAHTLDSPLSLLIARGAADTISRFIADVGQLSKGLTALFGKTMVEPLKAIAALATALVLDWKLTLLALSIGPLTYTVIRWLGKMIRKATRRSLQKQADMLRALEETLSGIRIVKSYNRQEYEKKRFRGINRGLYRQMKLVCLGDALSSPTIEVLGVSGAMLAILLGGYWVFSPGAPATGAAGWLLNNHMEPDKFITVLIMLGLIFDPVRKLSKIMVYFYNADAAAQRVFELADEPIEQDPPNAQPLPRHCRDIEFKNINFTYPKAMQPAINDVSLKVQAGQTVAIVGGNGSGKTTLLSLLLRFYDPASGQILIDGIDISSATRKSLWRQVGLVSQEPVIFNATVAENIGYGRENATREEIEQAARKAFAHEFIASMPNGYDSMIGEHGTTLSGGQRQRLAIARAILRDPAILVLDEATSQIDSESEANIHKAMTSFMADRTTLLIAHRFSTVVGADVVAVMQNGKLIATGKHDELVKSCGSYKALFESQLFNN